jgi:hypothetical protein
VIGATPLVDLDKFTVDSLVKRLAADWSKSVVQKVRTYLKAALEEAVDQDFIQRNPGAEDHAGADEGNLQALPVLGGNRGAAECHGGTRPPDLPGVLTARVEAG